MKSQSRVEAFATAQTKNPDNGRSLVNSLRDLAVRIDALLGRVLGKVEFLGHWKVAFAITIAIVLAVICARYYYSFVTGFIVPDEAWYYDTFILDRQSIGSYRPVFLIIFLFFFHGVNSVWAFLLRGALYSAIWAVGCVVMFLIILRRLKVTERMLSLLILSLPLFPIFIVLVPTVLTETLGLFIALLGVYFGLRYVQEGRIANSLVSVAFFVLAYEVREAYLLFVAGDVLLFLILSAKRKSLGTLAVYLFLIALIFPIPVQLNPLRFASPIYTWIVPWAPTLAPGFGTPLTTAVHPDLMSAIVVALGYGFNPLFGLFAVFSFLAVSSDAFRRRSSAALFLALNAVCSFAAFVIPVEIILESTFGALSGWTSSLIRTTHAALPCIIGFTSLYQRLRIRRVAALMIIVLIIGSTQIGSVADAFQRSLSREPVDRLSLEYRAPYYRLYLLAKDSGKTLVLGGAHMRGIRMYMAMLPNVVLAHVGFRGRTGSLTEAQFRGLLEQNWDSIFLYDDWVTIKDPSAIDAYPEFYSLILRSKHYGGYIVEPLWIDGESYALKMVKLD